MHLKEKQVNWVGKKIHSSWVYLVNNCKVYYLHILIRDGEYKNIVNVIPLEGGAVLVNKPKDFGGLIL